jgi:soluble lytic murein transglycosylase-like protein
MRRHAAISACMCVAGLAFCARPANAQITKVTADSGRQFFVNAEPPAKPKLGNALTGTSVLASQASGAGSPGAAGKSRATIYLPAESSFTGQSHPALSISRDGVEKMVKEAAERHRVDAALVRAVIETESNWNAGAISRKGALGLMQLIPTTAQRFGVSDAFSPQQNVDAGVRYLKTLLERYNGNLDLALAAYNAGEGAVDRAHGIPAFRETRSYIQKVQDAYFRPGSGRIEGLWINSRAIRKNIDEAGRVIFTND